MNGNRIKKLRERWGLTIEELSEKTGIDADSLSKMENGLEYLNPETAKVLSTYFNVSIDYLKGVLFKERFKKMINDLRRDYTFIDEWSPELQVYDDAELGERDKDLILGILELNKLNSENIVRTLDYLRLLGSQYRKENKVWTI